MYKLKIIAIVIATIMCGVFMGFIVWMNVTRGHFQSWMSCGVIYQFVPQSEKLKLHPPILCAHKNTAWNTTQNFTKLGLSIFDFNK